MSSSQDVHSLIPASEYVHLHDRKNFVSVIK